MSRALDDLDARFLPVAMELIARCAEAGIPVMIVDTLRTEAEHQENLRRGVSWTKHSAHLDGLAIDICPFEQFNLHGSDKLCWQGNDPAWAKLAEIGRGLGLRCGADWTQRDRSHFEYVKPTGGVAKPKATSA